MKGFIGTTIFPFILYKKSYIDNLSEEKQAEFWNHENIHGEQQKELWLLGFYILYFYFYLRNRKRGMSKSAAYTNNPFELEANDHEANPKYLGSRKKKAWKTYR
jgi:cbb3-type cytochrome oxidase subunit 3